MLCVATCLVCIILCVMLATIEISHKKDKSALHYACYTGPNHAALLQRQLCRGTRNVLCYVSNCLHCDASFAYSSTNYSGLISSYTCVGMVSTLVSDVFVSHSCGTS